MMNDELVMTMESDGVGVVVRVVFVVVAAAAASVVVVVVVRLELVGVGRLLAAVISALPQLHVVVAAAAVITILALQHTAAVESMPTNS